jgi:UDP:flavonoid glycosyltransferase YjiC (YdhE family)
MRFDIVTIGDFRFPGGTSTGIAHEIRALHGAGYSVGLVQKRAPMLKHDRPMHPQIRACLDAGQAVLVNSSHGLDAVEAKLAVLQNPYVFVEPQAALPKITATHKVLVAHQPTVDGNGLPYYDVATVQRVAEELVGPGVVWAPISALCRRNMADAGLPYQILGEDWAHVIFVRDWATDRDTPVGSRPVIGRHSRPEWQKWPASREEMLAVYPEGEEFEVRFLGAGDALTRIISGPLPSNWTTFQFNEIEPAEFLRTIDFFVYYHHPDWVEAFGRTILEAAAAGAVVIVPEHFRSGFGEAALYRQPSEVLDTVRQLYADWESYRLHSRLGKRTIDRMYGPKRYLARIRALVGAPGTDTTSVAIPASIPVPVAPLAAVTIDVVQLGDLRTARDTAWRIANETRIQAESGYSTGLVHVATSGPDHMTVIHPAIDELVHDGTAVPINPATPSVIARLLIVNEPQAILSSILEGDCVQVPRIIAEKVIVVAEGRSSSKELAQQNALLKGMFGAGVTWAATDPQRRLELAGVPGIQLEPEVWGASVAVSAWAAPKPKVNSLPVIGRIGKPGKSQWPESEQEVLAVYPETKADVIVRMMGVPSLGEVPLSAIPDSWETVGIHEMNFSKFLSNLDFLVYFPGQDPDDIPTNVIAWAMAHGVPAILPSSLESRFGKGPIYAAADNVIGLVKRLHSDPARFEELRTYVAREARRAFGAPIHKARLHRLVGQRSSSGQVKPARKRVLFLSSNGVGIGHLTRLLAIARRMPNAIEPVFATLSQAMPVVEQAGYPVEYLPFHVYANCDPRDWNEWLAEHLTQIIDFHGARAVVFDGGPPYGGLLEAVAPRRDVKLIWVRRGLWREAQNSAEAIRRQHFFDLIIEPSDVAEAMDRGATAANRALALKVRPIRLLDREELLDRATAASRLGLAPDKPAMLIQLGSGWNRDLASIVDSVLKTLAGRPAVQPVLAEWLTSASRLDLWPGVRRLRGFPISKYYNAFDFTISAAGYNSFNEIISFGLPAIFMANEHAMLDAQGARAAFAEENGAALRLPDSQVHGIGPLVEALLDEKVRWVMKANCGRLAQDNGAGEAAQAIAQLVA